MPATGSPGRIRTARGRAKKASPRYMFFTYILFLFMPATGSPGMIMMARGIGLKGVTSRLGMFAKA